MKDFIFHNPDKVYFGKNQIKYLPEELLKLGKRASITYNYFLISYTLQNLSFMYRN